MAFTKKIPTNQQTRMATFQIIHNCCCESVVQPEIKKMGMDNLRACFAETIMTQWCIFPGTGGGRGTLSEFF